MDRLNSWEHHNFWDLDSKIENVTGCYRPCTFVQYKAERIEYRPNNLPGDGWIVSRSSEMSQVKAVVQLFFLHTNTDVEVEFESYDVMSLVGEIGGTLGLFLGWSALQSIHGFIEIIFKYLESRNIALPRK